MPEENKAEEHRKYLTSLDSLVNMYQVDEGLEGYTRQGVKNPELGAQLKLQLGSAINPDDKGMFIHATPEYVALESQNYQHSHEDDIKSAYEKHKDKVITDYVAGVNKRLQHIVDEIKPKIEEKYNDPKYKDVKAEDKKKAVDQELTVNLYQALGQLLKDLNISEDFKDNEELAEAANTLQELEKIPEENKGKAVAGIIAAKNRLTPEYANLPRNWDNLYNGMISNYTRVIGKQLLQEKDGKYSIKEELLKKAYTNADSVKKMSPIAKDEALQRKE
ncbi:hypothetical protein J4471_01200 [Candidatus Woesearchaeota archaeon]|nr:hypothetical protein [Candidatus Woesearchaeota archaeon]